MKKVFFWKKIRVIVTIHGSDSFFFNYRVLRPLLKFALRSSDAVTCVSPDLVSAVRELSRVESHLLPMGVPDRLFEPRQAGLRRHGRLLFVGRVVISKGIDQVIAALDNLPRSFHLVIVGDGPYLSVLKSMVLGGPHASRVTFCGWLDEAGVRSQMSMASCLVLPSTAEGFSITVLEAMAARLPVVGNDIPALRAQLNEGRGYLVNTANPTAFAESILLAMKQDDDVIECASHFAQSYRWPSAAKGYETLYGGCK